MRNHKSIKKITKTLSANDVGANGAHQAGIHVPKKEDILSFFPQLNNDEKNPRVRMVFRDNEDKQWDFYFIYYNNKYFGGTRNEFRLTCISTYMKQNDLRQGDEIIFSIDDYGDRMISFQHAGKKQVAEKRGIYLSKDWKIIHIKEK